MPNEIRDLAGTTVAITGASSGIGAATARLLVECGAKVALQARHRSRLEELANALGAENAIAVPGDVQDLTAAAQLVDRAVATFGRLDSIVANAGIGMYGGILEYTDEEIARMLNTNVGGTVWALRAAVKQFRRAGDGGDIVVVSSVAGVRGGANEAIYAATKAAQIGLASSLDREVRAEGIRVTTICPAGTHTAFAVGAGRAEGDPLLDSMLRAEDVAGAVVAALAQPRRMRTTQWSMWSMAEGS